MKKRIKVVLIILVIVIVLISIFALIDYQLVKRSKKPIFCLYHDIFLDGGSKIYFGFGYIIVNYYNPVLKENRIRFGIFHRPPNPFSHEERLIPVDLLQ